MNPEVSSKIRASLLIFMLAVAKAHQGQQHLHSKEATRFPQKPARDFASSASGVECDRSLESITTDNIFQEMTEHVAEQLHATRTSPSLHAQAKCVAEQLETMMSGWAFYNVEHAYIEKMETRMANPNLQDKLKFVAKGNNVLKAKPDFRMQANHAAERMDAITAYLESKEQVIRNAAQTNGMTLGPNLYKKGERIADQMEAKQSDASIPERIRRIARSMKEKGTDSIETKLHFCEEAKRFAEQVNDILADPYFGTLAKRLAGEHDTLKIIARKSVDTLEAMLLGQQLNILSLCREQLDKTTFEKSEDLAELHRSGHRHKKASATPGRRLRVKKTDSVDRFIDETYGSAKYQSRVLLLVGALYASTFSLTQLSVFTSDKMIHDPKLPQFTKESVSFCQLLVMGGWAAGTLLFAPVFDQFGRRRVTYALGLVSGIAFICAAVGTCAGSIALSVYAVSNFAMGFGLPCFSGAYTIVNEIFPTHRRAAATAVLNVAYSGSFALSALICGTITRHLNWHMETLIWASYFMLLVLMGFPLVDESLRWLVASGHATEAAVVAKRISSLNGVDGIQLVPKVSRPSENNAAVFRQLLQKRYMSRLLAITINWIAPSICYYGLTFVAGKLSPNLYTSVALFGLVDIAGYFAPAPILSAMGRIRAQQASLVIAGALLLACGFLPHGSWPLMVCVLLARLSADVAFTIIYLITLECFPTDVRSTAFGITSSVGRFSSMAAPLMNNLPLRTNCYIFLSVCLCAASAASFLPETRGQGMDNIATSGPEDAKLDTIDDTHV